MALCSAARRGGGILRGGKARCSGARRTPWRAAWRSLGLLTYDGNEDCHECFEHGDCAVCRRQRGREARQEDDHVVVEGCIAASAHARAHARARISARARAHLFCSLVIENALSVRGSSRVHTYVEIGAGGGGERGVVQ